MAAVAANAYKKESGAAVMKKAMDTGAAVAVTQHKRGQIKVAKFCNHVGRILLTTTQIPQG